MAQNMVNNGSSKAKRLMFAIAYIIAVCTLTTGLAGAFPRYVLWTAVAMLVLSFGTPAFLLGWSWDDPSTREELGWIKVVPYGMLFYIIFGVGLLSAIRSHKWHKLPGALEFAFGCIVLATYSPFFLARAISRRRSHSHHS